MAKRKKTKKTTKKPYKHPLPSRPDILDFLRETGRRSARGRSPGPSRSGARNTANSWATNFARWFGPGRCWRIAAVNTAWSRGCISWSARLSATGTVSASCVRMRAATTFTCRPAQMRSVFDGDRVAVKIIGEDRRGRPEGKLVEVLERGMREVAGQFIRERGNGIVIPDNPKIAHRILIARGASGNARPGQVVIARIPRLSDSPGTGDRRDHQRRRQSRRQRHRDRHRHSRAWHPDRLAARGPRTGRRVRR